MNFDADRIETWLRAPREALDLELKSWIDPANDAERASLVKGMLALRNRDGGMIAIGFDNATGKPITPPEGTWSVTYHQDEIQGLVSKHASQPFEVTVAWFNSSVGAHPVIVVNGGVRTPVAVKAPVMGSGKQLVAMDAIYVRTLSSNNTPSSAPASHKDWEELTRVCFENREADIGRFVRRHLSPSSMQEMLAAFSASPIDDSVKGQSLAIIEDGERHFQAACERYGLKEGHEAALSWGYSSVSMVVLPPPRSGQTVLDQSFLSRLYTYARSTRTMIPPWHDGRSMMTLDTRPYTKAGAYEMFLDVPRTMFGHFEFSRLHPAGRFYCRSALREEVDQRRFHPTDTPTLDPVRAVAWIIEAFLTGAAFARSMDADVEESTLGFSFKWGNLVGRKLYNWTQMSHYETGRNTVRGDNEVTTSVEFRLSTPGSALAQYAAQAVSPLFAAFDWRASQKFFEHITNEVAGS